MTLEIKVSLAFAFHNTKLYLGFVSSVLCLFWFLPYDKYYQTVHNLKLFNFGKSNTPSYAFCLSIFNQKYPIEYLEKYFPTN